MTLQACALAAVALASFGPDTGACRVAQAVAAPTGAADAGADAVSPADRPVPARQQREAQRPEPPPSPGRTIGGKAPCPNADVRHYRSVDAATAALGRVKVGWTTARLRKVAGDPRSCEGGTWYYEGGLPDGPHVTYTVTIAAGKVAAIEHATAACIYREMAQ